MIVAVSERDLSNHWYCESDWMMAGAGYESQMMQNTDLGDDTTLDQAWVLGFIWFAVVLPTKENDQRT